MNTLKVIYSPQARRDIGNIQAYIGSKASPGIARAYVVRLRAECASLAWSANRGYQVDYSEGTVRRIGFEGSAAIMYRQQLDRIDIVSVTYRGINLPSHC